MLKHNNKVTAHIREQLAAAGNRIAVGSDLHLLEMLLAERDELVEMLAEVCSRVEYQKIPEADAPELHDALDNARRLFTRTNITNPVLVNSEPDYSIGSHERLCSGSAS